MNYAKLSSIGGLLLAIGSSMATDVTPTYDTFGNLAGANFGGGGIPTQPTAITTITVGNDVITLGLAATQRYSNPPLSNDGAGTYFATPGLNDGLVSGSPHALAATWNFDYYFDVKSGNPQTPTPYTFKLFMGTDASSLSSIDPSFVGDNSSTPNSGGQNSENLSFLGFGTISPPIFQVNPLFGSFDPNANADYNFVLEAFDAAGAPLGESAIVVRVASAPDNGSTVALLGLAIGGLGMVRRKFLR